VSLLFKPYEISTLDTALRGALRKA
jgi:hypothetical protein